jgi:tRNA(Ile)-lysidine synthase
VVEQLLNHIQRHNLCKTTDKILLAVSGGIDSMVMLHLFRQAGFRLGIAHCNFQLRGEDSRADEALVNMACVDQSIPFHVKRFDTETYADSRGMSIQMAARELRYTYFSEVVREQGYDAIATAHHLDDSFETVLLHLTKGTGFEGITGIPVRNDHVIRPMLFATRKMIAEYAQLHHLIWREDKSNDSDDYQRNFIRHQVVPALRGINPNLGETFRYTQERLQGAGLLLKYYVDQFRAQSITFSGDDMKIDMQALKNLPSPVVMLWEILKDKGFNYAQCQDILDNDHQSGKQFLSSTHLLTVDRQQFFVQQKTDSASSCFAIDSFPVSVQTELGSLRFEEIPKDEFRLEKNSERAQLDFHKVKFPLLWRTWKEGDSFIPLGMQYPKKLSDFLIDIKMPLPEKEKVTVIESAGTIIWVVGFRIHDRFKVTDETHQVMTIDFRPAHRSFP